MPFSGRNDVAAPLWPNEREAAFRQEIMWFEGGANDVGFLLRRRPSGEWLIAIEEDAFVGVVGSMMLMICGDGWRCLMGDVGCVRGEKGELMTIIVASLSRIIFGSRPDHGKSVVLLMDFTADRIVIEPVVAPSVTVADAIGGGCDRHPHFGGPQSRERRTAQRVPKSVPKRGPMTILRHPTPTRFVRKNRPEIRDFRPILLSPAALANRRLQPLGHLTADFQVYDTLRVTGNAAVPRLSLKLSLSALKTGAETAPHTHLSANPECSGSFRRQQCRQLIGGRPFCSDESAFTYLVGRTSGMRSAHGSDVRTGRRKAPVSATAKHGARGSLCAQCHGRIGPERSQRGSQARQQRDNGENGGSGGKRDWVHRFYGEE
jgi:hypothetical protein